ncbi:MAG TPA: TerB family tellurite resistance protein [Enhygromyxa sp.]|nr:TerB family tellurite resistance protein [Enhygromyxa sp.]
MAAQAQLESLAFLYLAFGHSTDGNLAPEEMRELAGKLREWAPERELGDIGELLKGAVLAYKGVGDKLGKARQLTAELRSQLDGDQLAKVVADLEAIALADGFVTEEEQAFIDEARATLLG